MPKERTRSNIGPRTQYNLNVRFGLSVQTFFYPGFNQIKLIASPTGKGRTTFSGPASKPIKM